MSNNPSRYRILTIGKVRKGWVQDGLAIYLKRLPGLTIHELRDSTPQKEAETIQTRTRKDEKLIIINRDHLMIKTINKIKPLLRQTCLIPLLSRGLWHILHDYTDLKRYEETIDDMSTDILTKLFSEDE